MIDFFGSEVKLLAKGEKTHRTTFGATITLALVALLIYSATKFIHEMNELKNANINSKEIIIGEYEGYSFNINDFKFAIGMVDFIGQEIPNENNRIFYITYYECTKTLSETTCSQIPSQICGDMIKQVSFENGVPEYYQNLTFCMSENSTQNNQPLRLQGSFRSSKFKKISAVIYKCVNTTEFQGCAPQNEIDSYFQKNTNVYYSYTSHQFNKESQGNPYQNLQSVDITPLYNRVRKYIKIYYQYSQSILDYNPFYFFSKSTLYDGVEYEKTVVDTAVDFVYDNSVAQIEIYLDSNKIVRYLKYQTLMDVAAKLGGFFSILRLIFSIFMTPITKVIYQLYLVNSFLKIQDKQTNKFQDKEIKLSFAQLIYSRSARLIYRARLSKINQLLDISEILINPLKLANQVEDLYISVKGSDYGMERRINGRNNNNQQQFIIEGSQKQFVVAEDQAIEIEKKPTSQRSINYQTKQEVDEHECL